MSGLLPMLLLTDRASVLHAIEDPELDADLKTLIELRDSTNLFVVQGGDTAALINATVGFAITGDDAEAFNYDSITDHGRWFEIALILDEVPTRIFVENDPGTELGIHGLCLSHFWPDGEGEGR